MNRPTLANVIRVDTSRKCPQSVKTSGTVAVALSLLVAVFLFVSTQSIYFSRVR
jgi:hypothetical protein